MNNKNLVIGIFASGILLALPQAEAGEFRVSCSYKFDSLLRCADAVSDIVTEKYIAKFPAKKFTIFVHSNIHAYSNGGYVAYAVAGVVPTASDQFPRKRFSTTTMERERRATQIELAEVEKENFREAVKQLMDNCEISPNCDVYTDQ